MVKLLVLQQWYGLSDPELERQALDRISFQHFQEFPGDALDQQHRLELQEAPGGDGDRPPALGGAAAPAGPEGLEGAEGRGSGRHLHHI